MRAAIYARGSTERQERQQTIDSQLDRLRAWARSAVYDLSEAHIFRDEGYSGARLDRPGLDALRDAVHDREVDIVGVLSPDRLARKYAYQVLLLEEFRRAGGAVAFVNHAISDDPGDQLLLQIQGAVAEYERALLAERFRRGKQQKARAGQFIGAKAPYGYRYLPRRDGVAGRLEIDPAAAETVHMLCGWLVSEGLTLRQILKRLNFGPWFPRCGRRPWSPSTVHHILADPVYAGTAYANRYEYVTASKPRGSRKPGYDGKGCRRLRPREQWIPIAVPPLVGQEIWDRAQAQLARNAVLSFRNNKKHDYLLRCLMTCGGGGLAMFGPTRPSPGGHERRYYRCAGKDCVETARAQPCPRACVDGEELERAVWDHVRDLLSAPDRLIAQFESFAGEADRGAAREKRAEQRLVARLHGGARAAPGGVGAGARRREAARRLPGRGDQPGGVGRAAATARGAAPRPGAPTRAAARPTPPARQGAGGAGRPDRVLRTGARPAGRHLVRRQAGDLAARRRAHHRPRGQRGYPPRHPAAQPAPGP